MASHIKKILAIPALPGRLTLLIHLAVAVGAAWVVEQPRGSLLFEHDRLAATVDGWKGFVNVPLHDWF